MRDVLVAFCLTALLGGCGTSLRMVHQSDAYFERCHAADYDAVVTRDERRTCWARWIEHYTPGQPPDRVAYASRRVRELGEGRDGRVEPRSGRREREEEPWKAGTSHLSSAASSGSFPDWPRSTDGARDVDVRGEDVRDRF